MCIIADAVGNISKNKIASFHVAYKLNNKTIMPAQLVIYSTNVQSLTTNNAFILPIYNPGNDPQKIVALDLSYFSNFLDEVEKIYQRWFPEQSYSSTNISMLENDCEKIEVHTVGNYRFSIMPSKADFAKLDKSILNINSEAKKVIDVHSNDYSFIIYQFYQQGNLKIVPFGYLCQPLSEDRMIIPTVQCHSDSTGLNETKIDMAKFDHVIYTMIKNPTNPINKSDLATIDSLFGKIIHDYIKRPIRIFCPRSFIPNKIIINDYQKNRNLLLDKNGYQYCHDLMIDECSKNNPPCL